MNNNVKDGNKSKTDISKVSRQVMKTARIAVRIGIFVVNEFFWEFAVEIHVMRIEISIDPMFRMHASHQTIDTGSEFIGFQ